MANKFTKEQIEKRNAKWAAEIKAAAKLYPNDQQMQAKYVGISTATFKEHLATCRASGHIKKDEIKYSKKLSKAELKKTEDVINDDSYKTDKDRAVALGLTLAGFRDRKKVLEVNKKEIVFGGQLEPRKVVDKPLPKKGQVKRYIITSAQNNCDVNELVWRNIVALSKHYNAEIMVGTFTYNSDKFGEKSVKLGTLKQRRAKDKSIWYDPQLDPHLNDDTLRLAKGLQYRGEINILPTAQNPLSGLESYSGRDSAIFLHSKIALESIPSSNKHEATKFNYATGCCTKMDYIQKKEGQKSEYKHSYGCLIIEVNSEGQWWIRQVESDRHGEMQDLDVKVKDGKLTTGNDVGAINWGDIHYRSLEDEMRELCWGKKGMANTLNPEYQFFHDTLDFHSRNHHDKDDCFRNFEKHIKGEDDVKEEVKSTCEFIQECANTTPGRIIIVESNHDEALAKWIKIANFKTDPKNAIIYLELALIAYKAIRDGKAPSLFRRAYEVFCGEHDDVVFLTKDQSFIVCGVEGGNHGHIGTNGSRGNPKQYRKMARPVNLGHTHSALICDNVYVAGVTASLDLGYNHGLSSWSQSHIITYPNGKRAIVTCWKGKWRAEG